MTSSRRPLGSTYRIQLNGFGLRNADELVAYLHDLGIETLYLSPIATATRGSTHGYDVTDPTKLDPSLGTRDDLEALLRSLDARGMRILLDIVPNHMSTSPENEWWNDVLRHGQGSRFARFFDIDWGAGRGRVLLPVLAAPLGEVIDSGELAVRPREAPSSDCEDLFLSYRDRSFPLSPETEVTESIVELLETQHYRLAYWKVAPYEVNYRRFFDINDLVGVRVEDPEVYRSTHLLTLRLGGDPRVAGVRVDHIDGLADPETYLRRLRDDLPDVHILVEKILSRGEELPESWEADGTTGYEFTDLALAVLTDQSGAASIADQSGTRLDDVRRQAVCAKREALERLFPGQVDRLAAEVTGAASSTLRGRDIPVAVLRNALVELTAHLTVYRIYATPHDRSAADTARVDAASAEAKECLQDDLSSQALSVLRDLMLGLTLEDGRNAPSIQTSTRLCARWQQLCSAVAAKGVEDTALYRFAGLQSTADVGSDPAEPAVTVTAFHEAMRRRLDLRSTSLNTTSTHDSKRSEDARCRLAVLSEVPERWNALVDDMRMANRALAREAFDHGRIPPGIESLVLQAVVAIWPAGEQWDSALTERVLSYCLKSAREAKVHTSWSAPDPAFESGLTEFAGRFTASEDSRQAVGHFAADIAAAAVVNSLALVILKTAAPGVPDFYQGTETWRPLLVDPDNRQAVDYGALFRAISTLAEPGDRDGVRKLVHRWEDGALKTFVIREALRARRAAPELFATGGYAPVEVHGTHRDRVVSFMRHLGEVQVLAVVPRLSFGLSGPGRLPMGADWGDTELVLPEGARSTFRNVLSGDFVETGPTVLVSDLLALLPVALLA